MSRHLFTANIPNNLHGAHSRTPAAERSKAIPASREAPSRALHPVFLLLPPVILAMPLGLPNAVSQPLALLLLFPLAAYFLPRSFQRTTFLILVLGTAATSVTQFAISTDREHSLFQAIRSFVPFLYLIVLVISYKDILESVRVFVARNPYRWNKLIRVTIYAFCILSFCQTVGFFLGIPIANALSSSDGRVMIFQTTSCVLLLYYGIVRQNYLIVFLMAVVVLGSGSKAILASALVACGMATFYRFGAASLIKGMLGIGVLVATVLISQPVVIDRVEQYITGSGGASSETFGDATREYEIAQAQETLSESLVTLFFGAGFSMQVSNGVPTFDSRWAENSKYDIENGYWGIFSKLGVTFTLLLVIIFISSLPKNNVSLALVSIEMVMFFKTSYQVFAYFDGVLILVWSIIISAALEGRKAPLASRSPRPGVRQRATARGANKKQLPPDGGLHA